MAEWEQTVKAAFKILGKSLPEERAVTAVNGIGMGS